MSAHNRAIRPARISVLAAAAIAVFAAFPVSTASAQGLFQALFGRAYSYAPNHGPIPDPFGMFRDGPRREKPRATGPQANYCVRTCDGKYFPISRGGKGDLSPAKVCSAMCPAAKTQIFSGGDIKDAVANDGKQYSSMKNAFAYRERIVDNCSCNGRDPYGVVNVDIENDPTLRTGDVIVRQSGLTVFNGGNAPHKVSDFKPVLNSRGMSPALHKQLSAIRVLPNNPHAPFSVTVTTQQVPVTPEIVRPASADNSNPRAESDTRTN